MNDTDERLQQLEERVNKLASLTQTVIERLTTVQNFRCELCVRRSNR